MDVAPGNYNTIDARMLCPIGDSISFFCSGKVLLNTMEVEFKIEIKEKQHLGLYDQNGFEVSENEVNKIWILIDLDRLLSTVDFNSAEISSENTIYVSKVSNGKHYNTFIENIIKSSAIRMENSNHNQ
jgi:hypothetical protein